MKCPAAKTQRKVPSAMAVRGLVDRRSLLAIGSIPSLDPVASVVAHVPSEALAYDCTFRPSVASICTSSSACSLLCSSSAINAGLAR